MYSRPLPWRPPELTPVPDCPHIDINSNVPIHIYSKYTSIQVYIIMTTILITGANTGIGFQIVRALSSSSQPYHVLVGARSPAKANDAIKAVQGEFPSSTSKYSPVTIDIESDKSIQNAVAQVSAAHGRLDVLINNAGMLQQV